MSLFTFDDVLERPMRERWNEAQDAIERKVARGKSTEPIMDVAGRVRAFQKNIADGLVVAPEGLLRPDLGFSNKHGPFIEYLVDRDLRPVQHRIARPSIRSTATVERSGELIPSQVVGARFGLHGGTRYEVLWTDIIAAAKAYRSILGNAKLKQRERGNVTIDYGDGILLRIYGMYKGNASIIDAELSGVPAHTQGNAPHASHYKLETLERGKPTGVFHIDSGYDQHRGKNWVTHTYTRNPLAEEAYIVERKLRSPQSDESEKASKSLVDRVALYAGDLLGLYLVSGIARTKYGVRVNQPLPALADISYAGLAEKIGANAIILDADGKRSKPNKTEWNQLLGIALAR